MKKLVSLLLALSMVLTLAVSMTACNKEEETEDTTTAAKTTADETETTTYDSAFEEVDGFDITPYEGNWTQEDAVQGAGDEDHVGTELVIEKVDETTAKVSIYNYKATVCEDQEITVVNNQAQFKTDDYTLSMTFGDDFITLSVLASSGDLAPAGTRDTYVR